MFTMDAVDRDRQRSKYQRVMWKAKVFKHYGTACTCCGTAEDLTIDHVDADAPRRPGEDGGFYRWLVRQGYPDGYQVLCRACNGSQSAGPSCRIHMEQPALDEQYCNPDHIAVITAHLYGKPLWPAQSDK